jgi:hypothetical protein
LWEKVVNESTEGYTISPARGEVGHMDFLQKKNK